jgi:hypothetical protein
VIEHRIGCIPLQEGLLSVDGGLDEGLLGPSSGALLAVETDLVTIDKATRTTIAGDAVQVVWVPGQGLPGFRTGFVLER